MDEKTDIGHAARSSEGRTAWVKAWNFAWEEACRAAKIEENHATGRSASRRVWAGVMMAARDSAAPIPSDGEFSGQWIPAWNAGWNAAWIAAIAAAKVVLQDRPEPPAPPRSTHWDAEGRAARATAGREEGVAAWNVAYRAAVKKVPS